MTTHLALLDRSDLQAFIQGMPPQEQDAARRRLGALGEQLRRRGGTLRRPLPAREIKTGGLGALAAYELGRKLNELCRRDRLLPLVFELDELVCEFNAQEQQVYELLRRETREVHGSREVNVREAREFRPHRRERRDPIREAEEAHRAARLPWARHDDGFEPGGQQERRTGWNDRYPGRQSPGHDHNDRRRRPPFLAARTGR